MDTTRGIARSYDKLCALTRFHSHQLQEPSRPPNARNRQLFRWQYADAPTGCRRRRLAKIRSLRLSPPSSHDQPNRSGLLRRKLKPARRGHGKTDEFTDHGAQATVTKTFLHGRQDILFPIGFGKDNAIGMKTRQSQRREKQIWTRHAPKDLSLGSRSDPSNAEGRCRTIDRSGPATGELVQGAIGQTAAREHRVYFGNPKSKAADLSRRSALKGGDTVA
ncbi:hypothetical protein ACVIKP_006676 [Rhizobium leguminosarum]